MMPLRIRRKGRPLEKLEIATALQRRKKSFQHDRTIRITLASGCDRFAAIASEFNGCDIKCGIDPASLAPSGCTTSLERQLAARRRAKLLGGQSLPDMSHSGCKV
ncbi:hypothetical protein [Bradyrhizobium iriomotense]|uniref:hypothetical protein n=1 Tax=Bradyrhizobium iriomotense TaxID=441950 RepID=UPI0024E065BB|nr:hypothetical protein [Bradyrhizobium iriomotense]